MFCKYLRNLEVRHLFKKKDYKLVWDHEKERLGCIMGSEWIGSTCSVVLVPLHVMAGDNFDNGVQSFYFDSNHCTSLLIIITMKLRQPKLNSSAPTLFWRDWLIDKDQ